jgi:hypothetical protein
MPSARLAVLSLHADAGAGQIGAADIDPLVVKDYHLGMNPWAQNTFQFLDEYRIIVEVFTEV